MSGRACGIRRRPICRITITQRRRFKSPISLAQVTVLRAGGRVSYQVFNIGNTETVIRQSGLSHQVETVVLNPSYPDPFANGASATPGANNISIRTLDANLVAP